MLRELGKTGLPETRAETGEVKAEEAETSGTGTRAGVGVFKVFKAGVV